jgi:hypothetical protein
MSWAKKGFLLYLIVVAVTIFLVQASQQVWAQDMANAAKKWDWNTIASGAVAISVLIAATGLFLEAVARRHANAVSSADLTLKMTEYFNSDRFLLIRHSAIAHLYKKYGLDWDCAEDSAFREEVADHELTADLREIFNFFNALGELAKDGAIREQQAVEMFALWIRFYYKACESEIDALKRLRGTQQQQSWQYLHGLYTRVRDDYKYRAPDEVEIKSWLRREHARTHRSSNPRW